MKEFKNIAVFCAVGLGNNPQYADAAKQVGQYLASQGIGLVYGGGTAGLMGAVASTVADASGPQAVCGVMPFEKVQRELLDTTIGQLVIVSDVHRRKALMAEKADGFITLPGGLGTLEELSEVITWQRLGFHDKPIGLLNVDGYFDHLMQFFGHAAEQGFFEHLDSILIDSDIHRLVQKMKEFKAPMSLLERKRVAAVAQSAVGKDVSSTQGTELNNSPGDDVIQQPYAVAVQA